MQLTKWIIEFGFSISLLVNALLFIPQIITMLNKRSAEGVSLITFGGFNVIQMFTMLHGLVAHDYILALGYFISILTCGTVSCLIIYYKCIKTENSEKVTCL